MGKVNTRCWRMTKPKGELTVSLGAVTVEQGSVQVCVSFSCSRGDAGLLSRLLPARIKTDRQSREEEREGQGRSREVGVEKQRWGKGGKTASLEINSSPNLRFETSDVQSLITKYLEPLEASTKTRTETKMWRTSICNDKLPALSATEEHICHLWRVLHH